MAEQKVDALQPTVGNPVDVVKAEDIIIQEYFGRVASNPPDGRLSACVVTVKKPSEEAYQTPLFDEYVLVLEGEVKLVYGYADRGETGGTTVVRAGQAAFLPKGLRVKWVWPVPSKYVPICLPAFSPENCGREEEAGNHLAKTGEAMLRLREMHAASQHPYLFHAAQVSLWEEAKTKAKEDPNHQYYPPTYEQDKFTHATADPSKLIDVLNHFYKQTKGPWVCLRMTIASLEEKGVSTRFEPTAPVGDIEAIDMGDQLFPHVYGGIPAGKGAVLEEIEIERAPDGTFIGIKGNDFAAAGATAGAGSGGSKNHHGAMLGVLVGALAGFVAGSIYASRAKS
eukprot:g693.t1